MTKARVNADNASADIQGVTAGTGLSGGGTSGTVTLTNDMATAIDAKGDLVVGTGADTYDNLAAGTNEHRLVAASGETTGLKYVADTTNYAIAAKGDLLAGTAADTIAALGVGANGTVLTADSVETTGLKWATPGGGAVVQVVSFATTSGTTTTSSSYVDTNQTLSITPTSASNKILVIATFNIYSQGNASIYDSGTAANLVRTSTELAATGSYWYTDAGGTARRDIGVPGIITYLDSPATTSAVTYKNRVKISMGSPVGASSFTPISITLMEVTP